MNKKIIFYFLTALVVLTFQTDSSYSIPTISKHDENYWTPEKMEKAKPLTTKNIGFRTRSGVETKRNTTDLSKYMTTMQPFERKYDVKNNKISEVNVDQIQAYPIGLLFMSKNDEDYTCTASVINTDDGNIGLTAAHCLYDPKTQSYFDNIRFSPGFDQFNRAQPGPLGLVPTAQVVVTDQFLQHNDNEFDWGMMRFNFNLNNQPLKYYTGALGWRFQPGNNIPTTIRGYPDGGVLANCPNDGVSLCTWVGVTTLAEDFYVVPDLNMGEGASGSPLMMNYDPNANLGLLYSNYASFDELNDELLAPLYDPIEFQALIGELTIH